MKINTQLPFDVMDPPGEFTSMDAVREISQAAERAGFNAGLVTDHPAPTGRWLDTGGHYAQGPFVMLAMVAAYTTRLRLQTGILVLPYRNPFATARDIATLDHFSGGRVTLSVGAGYLKGEYRAMGVPFDQRQELMDEYIRALRASLTGEEFVFDGTGYNAFGNRIIPGPVQTRLPIYCGGNARRAIRRAAELCDGWNPFFTSNAGTDVGSTRTVAMTEEADLAAGIAYMRDYCDQIGRTEPPVVVLSGLSVPGRKVSPQELIDRAGRFGEMGVIAAGIAVSGRSRAEWCDDAERIGAEIIAKIDG